MNNNQILRLSFQIDKSSKIGNAIWSKWGVLSAKARGYLIRELLYAMAANYHNYDLSNTEFAASLAKVLCNSMSPYSHVAFPNGIEKSNGMNAATTIRIDVSIPLDTDEGMMIKKLISTMSSKTVGKVIRILLYGAADACKRINFNGMSYYDITQFAKRLSASMCPEISNRFYSNTGTFIPNSRTKQRKYVWHTSLQSKEEVSTDAIINTSTTPSPSEPIVDDDYSLANLQKYIMRPVIKDIPQDFYHDPLKVKYIHVEERIIYAEIISYDDDRTKIYATLEENNIFAKETTFTYCLKIDDIREARFDILEKLYGSDWIKMASQKLTEVPLDYIFVPPVHYEIPDIDTGEYLKK